MSALKSVPVTHRRADDLVQSMLKPEETVQASVTGVGTFSTLLELIPFSSMPLELLRGKYRFVLTDRRVIVLKLSRLTGRVKSCEVARRTSLANLTRVKSFLTAGVRLQFEDGTRRGLERASKPTVNEFCDAYNSDTFAGSIIAAMAQASAKGFEEAMQSKS